MQMRRCLLNLMVLMSAFPAFGVDDRLIQNIDATANNAMAIKADGSLWAWGDNRFGQVGDGTEVTRYAPVQVGTDQTWVTIACGSFYSAGIQSDGTLWLWGANFNGAFGLGLTGPVLEPTQLGEDTDWVFVDCGNNNQYALKADGTLWTWGQEVLVNGEYQSIHTTPAMVNGDTDWVDLAVGVDYAHMLKADGTLWIVGKDHRTGVYHYSPIQLGTDTDWGRLAKGGLNAFRTTAIKHDGTLWAGGSNQHGVIGNGTASHVAEIVQVGSDADWRIALAGDNVTMGIKHDGSLWGWGANFSGTLGTGMAGGTSQVPIRSGARTDWVDFASGYTQAWGIRSDGTLWAWGNNEYGQLGIGDVSFLFANPVPILVGDGFRARAAALPEGIRIVQATISAGSGFSMELVIPVDQQIAIQRTQDFVNWENLTILVGTGEQQQYSDPNPLFEHFWCYRTVGVAP